jgi:LysR family transcriptional regulator, regulator of abg operon
MKLAQLRSLAAIADAGSIKKAAELAGLSQPALSKSIQSLEQELGANLLRRGARGVSLTDFGRVVVKRSLSIDREMDRMWEEIGWLKCEYAGRITVGITPLAGGVFLASAVKMLRESYPEIEIRITELRPGQILDGLKEGSLDVGLLTLHGETAIDGFECSMVKSFSMRLLAGGHRPNVEYATEDLFEEEWIETASDEQPYGHIRSIAASLGIDPPARILRCTSLTIGVELARTMGAICAVADIAVRFLENNNDTGRLTALKTRAPLPLMNCVMAYCNAELLSPACREFVKAIRILGREDAS